ncbi:MAG: hypothetical protein JO264_09430 [Acidisphaera sp.]|nr:hypothetical protein [Acidisphaera sp.]
MLSIGLGALLSLSAGSTAMAQGGTQNYNYGPLKYKVDPTWPKELPNNWILGQVAGLSIDKGNHIWAYQRPRSLDTSENGAVQTPMRSECCVPAPSVIEFNQAGEVINAWGGPGYIAQWPNSEHGILVDKQNYVWIAGNSTGDRAVLKFTEDGRLVGEIGQIYQGGVGSPPEDNTNTSILGQPAMMKMDEAANELYIADGYLNKRVVVYDRNTLAFKRGWGAYGKPLSAISNAAPAAYDPNAPVDQDFRNPVHGVSLSNDGLVYVSDRVNDRYQVFTKQGEFINEVFIRPATLGNGSVWATAFSDDAKQKYLLIPDGENNVVWEVLRGSGNVVGSFGHGGHKAGDFHWVHNLELDSNGNVFTSEVDVGKRVQKFALPSTSTSTSP